MISAMNIFHKPMARWAVSKIGIKDGDRILDIGCGGGGNIKRMLKITPNGCVDGVDYSQASVDQSIRLNSRAVSEKHSSIKLASVSDIPFEKGGYDAATAFQTVYFWPDIVNDMREVYTMLKPGGKFMVCNMAKKSDKHPDRYKKLIKETEIMLYSDTELTAHMQHAGFRNITFYKSRARMCSLYIGIKPQEKH